MSAQTSSTTYSMPEEPIVEETVFKKFHLDPYDPNFRIVRKLTVEGPKEITGKASGKVSTLAEVKFTLDAPLYDEHMNLIGTEAVFGSLTFWKGKDQTLADLEEKVARYRPYHGRQGVTIAFSNVKDTSRFSKDGSKYTSSIEVGVLDILSIDPRFDTHLAALQKAMEKPQDVHVVAMEEDDEDHPF
jgi:hypothetical protein